MARRPPLRFAHEVLEREMVRPDDLATILDVTPAFIRKCIRCETLRAERVGHHLRITRTEAVRFLASCGVRATDATRATA